MANELRCRCGHSREAHEHFRAGRDCSACADQGCRRFTPRRAAAVPQLPVPVPAWNRFRTR